ESLAWPDPGGALVRRTVIDAQVPSLVAGIALSIKVFLFEEGQDQRRPAFGNDPLLSIPDLARVDEQCPTIVGMGKGAVRVVVAVQGQADLLQVADALGAVGGLAGFLDGCQKYPDQDEEDRESGQQFDQRKGLARTHALRVTKRGVDHDGTLHRRSG